VLAQYQMRGFIGSDATVSKFLLNMFKEPERGKCSPSIRITHCLAVRADYGCDRITSTFGSLCK
jgi:hypothetical protein